MKYLNNQQCRSYLAIARAALSRYSIHDKTCRYVIAYPDDAPCTCGLQDVIDKIRDPNDD